MLASCHLKNKNVSVYQNGIPEKRPIRDFKRLFRSQGGTCLSQEVVLNTSMGSYHHFTTFDSSISWSQLFGCTGAGSHELTTQYLSSCTFRMLAEHCNIIINILSGSVSAFLEVYSLKTTITFFCYLLEPYENYNIYKVLKNPQKHRVHLIPLRSKGF